MAGFIVKETKPTGRGSVSHVVQWLEAIDKRASDLRPMWTGIIPEMRESMAYEFSDMNPNQWAAISPGWIAEKRAMGRPDTIGVNTGALKLALTESAKVDADDDRLTWAVNESFINEDGVPVGDYAGDFNAVREIFRQTRRFMRGILRRAVKIWIMKGSKQ